MILLYLKIFWTFFKIGLFGFGGGYAMISMIQAEVVSNHGSLQLLPSSLKKALKWNSR